MQHRDLIKQTANHAITDRHPFLQNNYLLCCYGRNVVYWLHDRESSHSGDHPAHVVVMTDLRYLLQTTCDRNKA